MGLDHGAERVRILFRGKHAKIHKPEAARLAGTKSKRHSSEGGLLADTKSKEEKGTYEKGEKRYPAQKSKPSKWKSQSKPNPAQQTNSVPEFGGCCTSYITNTSQQRKGLD